MIRWMFALILGLYLAIVGLVTFVGLDSIHHAHDSARNTVALCALRANLGGEIGTQVRKIERSEQFLASHPHGIPGITPKVILQGINDDRATLRRFRKNYDALRVVRCK